MKIKILILLKSIDGGTGTYLDGLLNIRNLYKKDELEIKTLVVDYPKYRSVYDNGYQFFSRENESNYSTFSLKGIKSIFNHISWLKKNISDYNPNIVLASNIYSIFISEATRYIYNIKFKTISLLQNNLLQVVDYKVPYLLRKFIKNLFAYIFKKSDLVITVSSYLSKDIYKVFDLKDLPSTIETFQSDYKTKHVERLDINNRILTVARLDGQKDYETLLQAFKIVNAKIPNSELLIVGDGPLRKKIENLSTSLKLDKNVKFLGWNQNPKDVMNNSDIFVLSSKFEGFPLVILEAMSHGLPIVSSNCKYGPYEIILKDKYGLLFEVGDVKALANTILSLLENRSLLSHYSKMSYARSKMFDRDKMLLKFKNIMDNLNS